MNEKRCSTATAAVYGSVVYKDEVYVIRSKQDVINLADIISK